MDEKRKEIIVNEIKHWKQSRLIPEQYCDFLLTLYTEGSGELEKSRKKNIVFSLSQLIIPLLILVAILVLYFTHISIVLQTSIGIGCIIAIVYLANKAKEHRKLLSYFYFFVGALLLYLLTIQVIEATPFNHQVGTFIATFVHCSLWLFIGIKWKIHFFTIASMLGIIMLIFFIL